MTAPQRHFPHSFWFPRTALPFGNTYPAAYSVAPAPPHGKKIPQKPNCGRGSRSSFLVLVLLPFRGGNSTDEDGEAPPLCAYKRPRPLADRTQSEGGERANRKDKKARPKSLVSRSHPPFAPRFAGRRGKDRHRPERHRWVYSFRGGYLIFLWRRNHCTHCPFTLFLVVVLVKESNFGFVLLLLSISFVALETRSLP